jgi:hypothetical protein
MFPGCFFLLTPRPKGVCSRPLVVEGDAKQRFPTLPGKEAKKPSELFSSLPSSKGWGVSWDAPALFRLIPPRLPCCSFRFSRTQEFRLHIAGKHRQTSPQPAGRVGRKRFPFGDPKRFPPFFAIE